MRNPDHWFKSLARKGRIEIQWRPRGLSWTACSNDHLYTWHKMFLIGVLLLTIMIISNEWNKKEIALNIASLWLHKLDSVSSFCSIASYLFIFSISNLQTCKCRPVEYTACLKNTWEERFWDDAGIRKQVHSPAAFPRTSGRSLGKFISTQTACMLRRAVLPSAGVLLKQER